MCRRLPTSGNVGRQQLNYHVTKHVYWVEKNQFTILVSPDKMYIADTIFLNGVQTKYRYVYEYLACLCYENHIY